MNCSLRKSKGNREQIKFPLGWIFLFAQANKIRIHKLLMGKLVDLLSPQGIADSDLKLEQDLDPRIVAEGTLRNGDNS
jgi:hypothetical protein